MKKSLSEMPYRDDELQGSYKMSLQFDIIKFFHTIKTASTVDPDRDNAIYGVNSFWRKR
jgi:hypothetical protein